MRPLLSAAGSSVHDIFGAPIPRSQVIYTYIYDIARAVPAIHWQTFLTGFSAIALLYGVPKLKLRVFRIVPVPLVVVALYILVFGAWMTATGAAGTASAAAAAASTSTWYSPGGVALVGFVPSNFPVFRFPTLNGNSVASLLATSVSVVSVCACDE